LFAILNVASFQFRATASEITWITISYMLPTALLGPIIGVFVDRWPLKPTLILSDVVRALLTLSFLFASTMWHFYAAMAAISVVSTFFLPAQGVGIRLLVPREGQLSASATMQQIVFIMRIAGPGVLRRRYLQLRGLRGNPVHRHAVAPQSGTVVSRRKRHRNAQCLARPAGRI